MAIMVAMPTRTAIAIAASISILGKPDDDRRLLIQVTPDGEFRANDGRPRDVPVWRMNAANAQRIIDRHGKRPKPVVVDYEHQTLHKEVNGQPAPAAAWLESIEYHAGDGLYAWAKLTKRAYDAVVAEEYQYFSPVFRYSETGDVLEILMGALTNDPALDDMQPLLAAANRLLPTEEPHVDELLIALRKLLGLTEDADQTAVIGAIETLQKDKAAADEAVAAATANRADPSKYVPIETFNALQSQVASLSSQQVQREVDDLIASATEQGKITAATSAWARDFGRKDLEGLRKWIEGAPVIAALTRMQTATHVPPLSSDDIADPVAVAAAARKWQDEQAAAGIVVSTAAAVGHVTRKTGAN